MSGKGKKKRERPPAAGAMAEDDDEEEGDNEEVMSLALEVLEMSAKGRALPRRRSRRQSVRRPAHARRVVVVWPQVVGQIAPPERELRCRCSPRSR